MRTIRPHFDQFAIDSVKLKLSEKMGYTIANKPDCKKLSEVLVNHGYGYLSEVTLYRLFFQSDKHTPYKNTLDNLCQFLGYKDSVNFLEYINSTKEVLHFNGINTSHNSYNNLIYFCVENTSFKPLADLFDYIEDSPVDFKVNLCISLFDSLKNSKKQNLFFKKFAHQKYIREYFFEKAHDPKFRIKNYPIAYLSYLEGIDKNKSIAQLQDYIFGSCVLFRFFFLNNQHPNALKLGKQLYTEGSSLEKHRKELYIFPFIRYTAYKLWYLKIVYARQNQIEDYANYLLDLCRKIKPDLDHPEQKIVFHTIAEAFLHSNLSESFHWELKKIYVAEYDNFPDIVYSKHLKYSLPYFDQNGLLKHRP